MKRSVLYFFLVSGLMTACEKDGIILYKIKYTTAKESLKSTDSPAVDFYNGLGDFVTSITPTRFSAKMNVLMYQDNWNHLDNSTHMVSYIDGHDNDPNYEISLFVDFSNNQEVTYNPILYSTDIMNGIFQQAEVTFEYFYFVPYFFSQEFEIPSQYGDLEILGNNGTYTTDAETGKHFCTVVQQPLLESVFGPPDRQPFGYFFGNTDSTYVFNRECADVAPSENHPNGGNRPMIRSDRYAPVSVKMPLNGESTEMYSTISFNTEDLIQVYAVNDNIPYTNDDILVYAPKYWERLNVKLETR